MENQIINETEKTLSESMIQNMKTAAPWMKFLAIVAFVGAGLLFIFGIIALSKTGSGGYGYLHRVDSTALTITALVYIVVAVVILILGLYLYKSANGYSSFCQSHDANSLETAFLMQKKYWKMSGIITIVYLSLLIIALLIAISAASSSYYY
jgi:hypothetical protein